MAAGRTYIGDDELAAAIGSTAVPGMPAKPVIDLMALVEELDAPIGAG